ncbi:MAG TPA: hypothetical protein QF873_03395 [Patescibacteria group bacterium]|nr:hypothetical protein [Patescibacteria group bacterium]
MDYNSKLSRAILGLLVVGLLLKGGMCIGDSREKMRAQNDRALQESGEVVLPVSPEGFNLHDDYANPLDVCGTYDFRPVLVSEPWNHTTIVMCAEWTRGKMVTVTQAGNSPAKVDTKGSFMWPKQWLALGNEAPFGAEGICGDDTLIGIVDSTDRVIVKRQSFVDRPTLGVWPMCFNAETRRVRFVVEVSRNKGPLTNVTLASQLRF